MQEVFHVDLTAELGSQQLLLRFLGSRLVASPCSRAYGLWELRGCCACESSRRNLRASRSSSCSGNPTSFLIRAALVQDVCCQVSGVSLIIPCSALVSLPRVWNMETEPPSALPGVQILMDIWDILSWKGPTEITEPNITIIPPCASERCPKCPCGAGQLGSEYGIFNGKIMGNSHLTLSGRGLLSGISRPS